MKALVYIPVLFWCFGSVMAQNIVLFDDQEVLDARLNLSIKELKEKTNDSTYMPGEISFLDQGAWNSVPMEVRVRGNFRRKNCYYPPLKLRFNPSATEHSPFSGHRKLKVVMPCLLQKPTNDNLLKEYLAYKLYETIAPVHFRTHLMKLDLTEEKGKKVIDHQLYAFFIEDLDLLEERFNGREIKKFIHPLNQEDTASVRVAFFHYMIGNTDFSAAYGHNGKLLFINRQIIPIPYDFDLCGMVDASYAVVSKVEGEELPISSVRERTYRGFIRDAGVFEFVRSEYLARKARLLAVMDEHRTYFEDVKEFETARAYLLDFFEVLEDDKKFKRSIVATARSK